MEKYTDVIRTNKPTYKCGVCGKSYYDIRSRMECEQACIKRAEEEAKNAAEEKKKEEKSARKVEVDEAIKHADALLDKYIADYGAYYGKDSISHALYRLLFT